MDNLLAFIQNLLNNAKNILQLTETSSLNTSSDDWFFIVHKQGETEANRVNARNLPGLNTVVVNGNPFFFSKNPANTGSSTTIEENDIIINGWWDNTEFWVAAQYDGGNINTKTNWTILNKIGG